MRQATDCTQVTVTKKLSAATFGLGSIDHEEPFQFSMNVCGWKFPPPPPPNVPWEPTAQHWVELTQVTLLRIPPLVASGTELETSVQPEPFQCCNKSPDAMPLVSVVAPDAQQSEEFTQVTP